MIVVAVIFSIYVETLGKTAVCATLHIFLRIDNTVVPPTYVPVSEVSGSMSVSIQMLCLLMGVLH